VEIRCTKGSGRGNLGHVEPTGLAPLGLPSAARIGVDVWNHAAVEDRLLVGPAVVDTIKTDDGAAEIHAHLPDDAHHFGQCLPQERRFVAMARATTNGAITLHWRSQKATTLSPFTFLCPLKPRLSPPFFAAVVVPSP
jgi:hypothetical protein